MAIEVFPTPDIVDLLLTGTITTAASTSTSLAERAYVSGDTSDRFQVQADGKLKWGPGNAVTDVTLNRSSVATLSLTGKLTVSDDTHFYGSTNTFDGTITASGRITGDSGSGVPSAYFGDASQNPGGTVGIMPYTAMKGLVIKNPASGATYAIEHLDSASSPIWRIAGGMTQGIGAGNFGAGALGAASGYINLTETGNDALVAAQHGTLDNASLVLMPKGTGMIQILDGSGSQLLQVFARAAVANSSTALKLFWIDNTSAFRYDSVTVGAANSGGAGKRVLLVPN